MTYRALILSIMVAVATTGCGLIYKQNIQQGNAIEQEDLDELYVGMNRRQVLYVLGTPSIKDPFHHDRWDYVQTFSRRGGEMVERKVTLRFENDLLAEIIGKDNPFAAEKEDEGSDEVATFVKKPEESPHKAALDSVEEDVLGAKPDIDAAPVPTSEDREYKKRRDTLDQTPDSDPTTPDIDG